MSVLDRSKNTSTAVDGATEHEGQSQAQSARAAERRQRLAMAILTGVCAGALIISWIGRSFFNVPPDVLVALGVIAYAAGGGLTGARAIGELWTGVVSIDLLMITAALGAASVGDWIEGGILLFLFSLSNTLERFALHRTRRAIEALLDLSPPEATVRRDGREIRIPSAQIHIGDTVLVMPGERIPADGQIVLGVSSVDESPMTGESVPVDKAVGDAVFAGTLNQQGAIEILSTKDPNDTTLHRIIRMVEEAQSAKAESQQFTDWFGRRYTIGVFAVAGIAAIVPWLALHESFDQSFYRAMTLLVVGSPCAVVISIPAAILSAIARAARDGILFKGGAHVERAAKVNAVAFDKTGTLTVGRPRLVAVEVAPGVTREVVLQIAASAESRSEHPLARAIVEGARLEGVPLLECSSLEAVVGSGIRARLADGEVIVGKRGLLEAAGITIDSTLVAKAAELAECGQTTMFVASGGHALGVVAVADAIRPTAKDAIDRLRTLGVTDLVMLTGDHNVVASRIANELGVSYQAELLPEDKARIIGDLMRGGSSVAMVGDGINDAPSLALASLGVSLGGNGTDVAIETADLVLMGDDLRRLPHAIALARQMNRIIRQNLIFAFSVMAVLLVATFAESLRMPYAVVGHEGSTVLVILNGLRLLSFSGQQ